jgi:acyl carrier protein
MEITLEEFKQKFSEAIEDETVIQFEPDFNFKNLESWDSFSGMSIISMIDQEFGITINAEEMARINTINELYDSIEMKINAR